MVQKNNIKCPSDNTQNFGNLAKCPGIIFNKDACNIACNIKTSKPYNCGPVGCDYPFEQLTTGKWKYSDLEQFIKGQNKNELKQQIKYNLSQLISCSIKKPFQQGSSPFGTLDWWKENIWGVSLIQNFIYLISFFVSIVAIIYLTYRMLYVGLNIPMNKWVSYIILIPLTIILIILTFVFSLTDIKYWEKPDVPPQCKDFNIVATDQEYDKESSKLQKTFSSVPLLFIIGSIVFINTIMTILAIWKPNKLLTSISTLIWISLAIVFNTYFAFLIPQIIIVGLLLQKYYFSSSGFISIVFTFILTIIMFFSALGNIGDNLFISLILPIILVVYIVMKWFGYNDINNWSLLLFPIISALFGIQTGTDLVTPDKILY